MARRARVISIDLKAGTATFFKDLDAASGKIKQFGHGTVSDMQASSAAVRELMGGNNVRAVERFLGTVLGLGPALKAAFPVIGALAFGGIIVDLTEKANKFFTELRQAPELARQAFQSLSTEGAITNASLIVSIDNLNKEIDKLEGKHHNALKDMLDEAILSALKLDTALDSAFGKLTKELDEHGIGKLKSVFTGQQSDYDAREMSRAMQAELDAAGAATRQKMQDAKTLAEFNAARKEHEISQQGVLNVRLADTIRLLKEAADVHAKNIGEDVGLDLHVSVTKNVNALNLLKKEIENKLGEISLAFTEGSRKQTLAIDQAIKEGMKEERPYTNKINELKAQLVGLNSEIGAVGASEGEQIIAKAGAEADKAIATIRNEIEKRTPLANPDLAQEEVIKQGIQANVAAEEELAWKRKVVDTTDAIRAQRQEQDLLTEAIGKGYEAVKAANVEAEVMRSIGAKNYFTPGFLGEHADQISGIRTEANLAQDQKHTEQTTQEIQKLKESIELEYDLAFAYRDGAEAVRQATIAVEAHRMAIAGATEEQIKAYIANNDAKLFGEITKRITDLDLETEARKRLAAAIVQGSLAERQAALANQIAAIQRGPGTQEDREALIRRAKEQFEVNEETRINSIASASRKVAVIDEQITDLYKARVVAGANQAQIDADILAKERERLSVMREQLLATNSISAGLRAAMLDFQLQAKTTSQIVSELTHQAIEAAENLTAKNLADLMTGQHKKGEFGKDLQQLGGNLIQSSLKEGLGHLFGGGADGKSALTALWVRMAGGGVPYGPSDAQLGVPGATDSGSGGGIFSGVAGMISHLFGAGHAEGGPVSPGTIYPVGEQGPELFAPDQPGSIIPSTRIGGAGPSVTNVIDARGSDLGAWNRISRGLEMTHKAAVTHAVQADADRKHRVPSR